MGMTNEQLLQSITTVIVDRFDSLIFVFPMMHLLGLF